MVDPKLSEDGSSVVVELDERERVFTKAEALAYGLKMIEAATGYEPVSTNGEVFPPGQHDWVLVRFIRIAWQADEMRRVHGDAMADSYLRSKGRG